MLEIDIDSGELGRLQDGRAYRVVDVDTKLRPGARRLHVTPVRHHRAAVTMRRGADYVIERGRRLKEIDRRARKGMKQVSFQSERILAGERQIGADAAVERLRGSWSVNPPVERSFPSLHLEKTR